MAQFATLILQAETQGLRTAKSDLMDLKRAGADTEQGVRKAMAGVEASTGRVPRAANSAAAAFDSLRMSIDPLYSQSRHYEAAVRQVDAALSAGVATQAQANRVLDLASQRYLGAANGAREAAEQVANVNARMGGGMNGLRNFSLQLGQVAQQGAVTGDYLGALAIQSGDMLLGFGTLGAVLGVVAAVMAPLAIDMLKSSEAAAALNFNVTALQPVFSGLASIMAPVGSAIGSAFTAMAENLDRVVIIAGTAATLFAGKFVAGVVAARVATMTFAGSLVALRGALVRTGIGALVVGAGELVYQFSRLVGATGSFGAAMGQLGTVAAAVWQGIIDSGEAIPPALDAVWSLMKAGFFDALAAMANRMFQFINSMAGAFAKVEALQGLSGALLEVAVSAGEAASDLGTAGREARAASEGAFSEAAATIAGAFDPAREAVAGLAATVANAETNSVNLGGVLGDLEGDLDGSGKAAKDAAKDVKALADEIEALNDAADPTRKFARELDNLNNLASVTNEQGERLLTDAAYSTEFERMNAELVESTPLLAGLNDGFGQFIDYALDGFKDGMAGIWDIFKRTLASMIATAAKSRITFGLGMAATGGAGAAAAGQPGGGIMSSIMPSVFGGSGLLAGVGAGASAALGLGGYTSAGIFSIGANAATAAAATGASALSSTIGAALPVIGIGLALVGLFKKTEVLVAEGVRARIDGAMLELDSYEKTKKDNMFGMSSGFSRDFDRMDDEVQSAVQARLNATIASLEAFGLGTDLTGFSFSKRTEIKDGETFEGESEEVIREALSAAIEYATDGALDAFTRSGEDMAGTLERLVTSLNSVNPILDALGSNILPISLDGAAAASALADLAGGLEAFGGKAAFVFENFLTDQERLNFATQQLNATFGAMSVALPETHAQFRALMDAQDLTTEAGRQLYTALLDVAPLFVEVKGTAQDAAGALEELAAQNSAVTSAMSNLRAAIAAEVSPLQDQLRVAQDAMRESESVANALRNALRNMRTESQRSRVRASAQATLSNMLSAGRVTDTEAFRDALSVVQEPSENLFGSFVEYQRDFYRTANLISSLETKADRQLSADQRTASGIETQISQLNALIGQYDTQISATMSVTDAVRSLEAAITAQQQAATAASPASREDAYLAANPDVAAAVAAGMFSSGAEHFALHGQFEDRPAFANGGMHSGGMRLVGERGPELEVTGPSRIYSASQTKQMMHDDVLRKEVREMKEYMRELVKINNKQERTLKEIEIQGETA